MKTDTIKLSQEVIDAGVSAGKDYGYLVDYVGRAYLLMVALPVGRTRISSIAYPETTALFIEVVKQYMRETPWSGYISLDKEPDPKTGEVYDIIRKHEPWREPRDLYAKKQEVTDEA